MSFWYKLDNRPIIRCYSSWLSCEVLIAVRVSSCQTRVVYICASLLRADESRDLSQAETNIIIVTSWTNELLSLKMARGEKHYHFVSFIRPAFNSSNFCVYKSRDSTASWSRLFSTDVNHLEHSIWVTFAFQVIPEVEAVVKVNVVAVVERPFST